MTEGAWLSSADPLAMWEYLRRRASERKCRLLAAAALRRLAGYFSDDAAVLELLVGAAEAGERFADGTLSSNEFRRLREQFHLYTRLGALSDAQRFAGEVVSGLFADSPAEAAYAITFAPDAVAELDEERLPAATPRREREIAAQASLVRDLFGNPFRPVTFDPAWQTEAAVGLARGIYESGDFGPMQVLADALEDAGCADAEMLAHCRGDGPHVRGCWVVDLVLGNG